MPASEIEKLSVTPLSEPLTAGRPRNYAAFYVETLGVRLLLRHSYIINRSIMTFLCFIVAAVFLILTPSELYSRQTNEPRRVEFCVGPNLLLVPESYLDPISVYLPSSNRALGMIALWPQFNGIMAEPYPQTDTLARQHVRRYINILVEVEQPNFLRRRLDSFLQQYGLVLSDESRNGLLVARPLQTRPGIVEILGERIVFRDDSSGEPEIVILCSTRTSVVSNPICRLYLTENGLQQTISFSIDILNYWRLISSQSRNLVNSLRREEFGQPRCHGGSQ
jgi:hypothetical protein